MRRHPCAELVPKKPSVNPPVCTVLFTSCLKRTLMLHFTDASAAISVESRRRRKDASDRAGDGTHQAAQPVRKTRTRKKYTDLPAHYAPNGLLAAPLAADWREHGLGETSPIMPSADKLPLLSARTTFPRTQLAMDITENLSRFSHCILLTRVGNFYEVSSASILAYLRRHMNRYRNPP